MSGEMDESVREATSDLFAGLGIELVYVEVERRAGRSVLRIYIDREGGVTVEECARASGLAGKVLERDGIMPSEYVLEVMSPGLYMPLRRPEDFERSIGKRVRVKLRYPFEGRSEYTGFLTGVGRDVISLDVGTELLELRRDVLSAARLDPELPW